MNKKRIALLLAALFVLGLFLTACGETSPSEAPKDDPNAGEAPDGGEGLDAPPVNTTANDGPPPAGAFTFDDGNTGFLMVNLGAPAADPADVSIVDYNGGKALRIDVTDNGNPHVGIDVGSMFGADAANIRYIETRIRTEFPEGKFYAASGKLYIHAGDKFDSRGNEQFLWAVSLERNNPRTLKAELSDNVSFNSSGKNIIVISKEEDLAISAGAQASNLIIDYILFLDGAGNPMTPNTAVSFSAPEGFGEERAFLYTLTNKRTLNFMNDGATGESTGYKQAGKIDRSGEEDTLAAYWDDMLVPGAVIEVAYASAKPPEIILQSWSGGAGWAKVPAHSVNLSGSIAQFLYEDMVEAYGDDFSELNRINIGDTGTDLAVQAVQIGQRVEDGRRWLKVAIGQVEYSVATIGYYDAAFIDLMPLNDPDHSSLTVSDYGEGALKIPTTNQMEDGDDPDLFFDVNWIQPGCYITAVYESEKGAQFIFQGYDPNVWSNTVGWMQSGVDFAGGSTNPELGIDHITYEKIMAVWEAKGGDPATFYESFDAFFLGCDGVELFLRGLVIFVPDTTWTWNGA
jgi:hypothetical protein